MNEIDIFDQTADLFNFAAEDFTTRSLNSIQKKGYFFVSLAGGNTTKFFFEALVESDYCLKKTPWDKIQFFFGDERYVSAHDTQSNYHTAQQYLFCKTPVNPQNIHRIPTEASDPQSAAEAYENHLRQIFKIKSNEFPTFDLMYLGLGDNSHTASLMPQSDIVKYYATDPMANKNTQLAAALYVPELNMYRITLTPPVINQSQSIVLMATGLNKAQAAWNVLEGPYDPIQFPAQLIHGHDRNHVFWYFDKPAASQLTSVSLPYVKQRK